MYEIKDRWTREVMHKVADATTMREAVAWLCVEAAKEGTRADLTRANLTDADLTRADLTRADLTDARINRLSLARLDFFAVLDVAPASAEALLVALRAGKIDGLTYTGECSCLLGTIARTSGQDVDDLPGLPQNSSRPAEQWFVQIRPGHTPEISAVAALTEVWILEWMAAQANASPRDTVLT
jgi:hypothetical protein